ncbi:MAG TPA: hypothetical protein VFT64_02615 [Rickettsiales bacterium]|nr:hypothetical protein [Rickettsiales bacterium]
MVDMKDILNGEDVNQEMLNALTVLMAGLGIRSNGTEQQKQRSAEAARFIAARYAKRMMEINTELFQQAQKQRQQLYTMQRSLNPYDPSKKK